MEILKKNLNFKSSFQFPCSYLSGKNEKRLYINLEDSEDKDILISELTQKGFRRNFDHMYFPICEHCKLCIPTRISIKDFQFSKSNKRNMKINSDLILKERITNKNTERFELFKSYCETRHNDSHMSKMNKIEFESFFYSSKNQIQIYDLVDCNQIIFGSILVDLLQDGYSAVYSFFNPDLRHRGLGKNLVIQLVKKLKQKNLSYLYLGYWVKDSRKMDYKIMFNSLEIYINGKWVKKEKIKSRFLL